MNDWIINPRRPRPSSTVRLRDALRSSVRRLARWLQGPPYPVVFGRRDCEMRFS